MADLKYYGFWNPQSPSAYLTHDTSVHLTHMGVGCELKIKDTSTVQGILKQVKDVISKVNTQYPTNGFYFQSIFFEQGDLNNQSFYNKVVEIADSVNLLVLAGKAKWSTLKQAYTLWENTFQKQMFQWQCGDVVSTTGLQQFSASGKILYPNPSQGVFTLNGLKGKTEITIYDQTGRTSFTARSEGDSMIFDLSHLSSGIYFLIVEDGMQRENFKLALIK